MLATTADAGRTRLLLHHMVLADFKSYAGRHELGPFHESFTAVVGPNGSGKSNVIDALLFVFGYRASKMRHAKVGHLVHRSALHQPNECRVEVHMHELDGHNNVVPDSAIVIARTATTSHQSRYSISGHVASHTQVAQLLRSKGIDLDHNRFLILQGEVEAISQMPPLGLLSYLEDMVGTTPLKEPLEEAQRKLDELTEQRNARAHRVALVHADLTKLRPARDEAVAYLDAEKSLAEAQFRLCRAQERTHARKLDDARHRLVQVQEELSQLDASVGGNPTEARAEAERLDREVATVNSQLEALQKEAADHDRKLAQLATDDVKLRELKKSAKRRVEKCRKLAHKCELDASQHRGWMANHDADRDRVAREVQDLQQQAEAAQVRVDELAAKVRTQTRGLQDQVDALAIELRPLAARRDECKTQRDTCAREIDDAKHAATRRVDLHSQLEALEEPVSPDSSQLASLQAQLNEVREQFVQAEAALANARETAQRLRIAAEEARQQHARPPSSALVAQLKRHVSHGVHDRLGNLGCIEARYEVAVCTAAGGSFDMVVVDTVATAQQCVEALRAHRLGRAQFLCLDKLPQSPPLRKGPSTDATQQRLYDLITPDNPGLAAAFYKAVGETLVADDLDTAKRLAFSGQTRRRVVTLGGALIDVAGTMSGGGNTVIRGRMRLADGASQQEQQAESAVDVDTVVRDRDAAVARVREAQKRFQTAQQRVAELERQCADAEVESQRARLARQQYERTRQELEQALANLPSTDKPQQIKKMQKQLATLESDFANATKACEAIEEQIAALQAQIDEVGGVEYKVAKSQLADFRQRADTAARDAAKHDVQRRHAERAAVTAEKAREKHLAEAEEAQAELEALAQKLDELTAKALAVTEQLESCRAKIDEIEEQAQELRAQAQQHRQALETYLRQHAELEAKSRDLQQRIERAEHHAAQLQARRNECERTFEQARCALEDAMRDPLAASNTPSQQGQQQKEGEGAMEVDKQDATDDAMQVDDPPQPESAPDTAQEQDNEDESTLATRVEQLTSALASMPSGNLRVLDEWRTRTLEHADRARELRDMERERDNHRTNLDALKRQRLTQFMQGFTAISARLKDMYALLTCGGNAELELVDSMDPFAEGIVFSVMPPKKSWKAIANLSGGEKTLASLALVFALHAYRPTPLYVLDEIDAALDFRNVSIIANYVRDQAHTMGAQFVIVSLRSNMFELADRLIGIYKTHNCTKTVAINPARVLQAATQQAITAAEDHHQHPPDGEEHVAHQPEPMVA